MTRGGGGRVCLYDSGRMYTMDGILTCQSQGLGYTDNKRRR